MTSLTSREVCMKTWQLQEAKAKFSEVVSFACSGEPQLVTRNGRPAVYVISADEYKKNKPSLKELLLNSPHKDIKLNIERSKEGPREIEF